MNKLRALRTFVFFLCVSLAASPVLAQMGMGMPFTPQAPPFGDLFISLANDANSFGLGSGTQTYAGLNRTRVDKYSGLLTAVGANTVRFEENGALFEGQAAQLLINPNTFSVAGGYTLSNATTAQNAVGPSGAANEAWTFTDSNAAAYGSVTRLVSKSTTDSTTYFLAQGLFAKTTAAASFPGFGIAFSGVLGKQGYFTINTNTGVLTAATGFSGAANIGAMIKSAGNFWFVAVWAQDNGANNGAGWAVNVAVNTDGGAAWSNATVGTCIVANGTITTGKTPSSYFAGAAAIGSELVTDGGFAAVTDVEEAAGVTVIGNCYKILQRTDIDYTADGAPDNNVGTYFNSTVGGATIDGSGGNDRLSRIKAANWTEGAGWAPQATAGILTGKMQKIAGTASNLDQNLGNMTGKVGRFNYTTAISSGSIASEFGGATGSIQTVSGTYIDYTIGIVNAVSRLKASAGFAGTIDDVSVREHGTVRASEAGTTTWTLPANLKTALAADFAIVFTWTPKFAKGATAANVGILAVDASTTKGIYLDNANSDQITASDGANTVTINTAYAANTPYKIALIGNTADSKMYLNVKTGATWGTWQEGTYDGSMNPGTYLYPFYATDGAAGFWIKDIAFYVNAPTTAYIAATH